MVLLFLTVKNQVNKLPKSQRKYVIDLLVEGISLRDIQRITGHSIITVAKLLKDAGKACSSFQNDLIRNLRSKRVEVREIWSFCYAKYRDLPSMSKLPPGTGDTWAWIAVDADTKLIICYRVGSRGLEDARFFVKDIRSRLSSKSELTFSGPIKPQLVTGNIEADIEVDEGASKESFDFSYSKKLDTYCNVLSLYSMYYNWCMEHFSLGATPAVAAGKSHKKFDASFIVDLMDHAEKPPNRPKKYKVKSKNRIKIPISNSTGKRSGSENRRLGESNI